MAYQPQEWRNDDPSTPLSAERLLHMEEGIAAATKEAQESPWELVAELPSDPKPGILYLMAGPVATAWVPAPEDLT